LPRYANPMRGCEHKDASVYAAYLPAAAAFSARPLPSSDRALCRGQNNGCRRGSPQRGVAAHQQHLCRWAGGTSPQSRTQRTAVTTRNRRAGSFTALARGPAGQCTPRWGGPGSSICPASLGKLAPRSTDVLSPIGGGAQRDLRPGSLLTSRRTDPPTPAPPEGAPSSPGCSRSWTCPCRP